ncbi:helix-turn-helix domain-containing protein [Neobittarella massiliensis]|uniref:Putative zinc finger/helix-turn-helix protein, YgiT family n=1 Tax=uncultured Anaerotruncus sp. TaxID=905011 RepID=A0A1C6GZN3_9FIRM|nr:helix-turn-helix transcriptional regulator [Neobittarella massiliensis]SCJ50575.1 putative zinc finger/helix-turn-helix protein%2C YgiT family [uncultured Anaerotruncus sp.]
MAYKHIKDLRVDRDIRQRELAQLLGMAQNTYSQYETGTIALTAEVLCKLADFYGTSVDYLLDRTDDPAPPPSRERREHHKL